MNAWIALAIGLLSGAHTSTWGMYKDSPHEGFTGRKYGRSILLSGAIALVWEMIVGFDLTRAWARVVLFGLIYVTERGLVELYKTFLREEDQSKYFIPMQLAVFGKPVQSRGARLLAGAGYVLGVLALIVMVGWIDRTVPDPMPLWLVVLVGGLGG